MACLMKVTGVMAAVLLVVGCSSKAVDSPTSSNPNGDGTGGGPGGIDFGDANDDTGRSFDAGPDGPCAASTVNAHLTRVNLVIIVDKSGSMGNPSEGGDPAKKWNPMVSAFTTFFRSVKSPALYASFTFFPAPCGLDETPGSGGGCVCQLSEYRPDTAQANVNQTVPLAQIIDDPDRFVNLLNQTSPTGGTPTIAALKGSFAYASDLRQNATDPEDVTSVILITDGVPQFGCTYPDGGKYYCEGCNGNDVDSVAQLVQGYHDQGIDTYVFGVGNLPALSTIADAGGHELVTIDVGEPETTTQQFLTSLNKIPVPKFKCSSTVPPTAPDGTPVNPGFVNVSYKTSATSSPQPLYYNAGCNVGEKTGWMYSGDDIVLCPATCNVLSADSSTQLALGFGCVTEPVRVN